MRKSTPTPGRKFKIGQMVEFEALKHPLNGEYYVPLNDQALVEFTEEKKTVKATGMIKGFCQSPEANDNSQWVTVRTKAGQTLVLPMDRIRLSIPDRYRF